MTYSIHSLSQMARVKNSVLQDCNMNKWQIMKNFVVLSCGWVFVFTAFNAITNLQTSLNREDGVGVDSLTTIYSVQILSSLFLPDFIISRLGCKWTISATICGYTLYMAANFYAVKATMIPAAVILGLCSAPLWSAKGTAMTQLAVWYAKVTDQESSGSINNFFGIFFMFHHSTQIWGNLISSMVFTPTSSNDTYDGLCGADFCPETSDNKTSNFEQPSDKVYLVCTIYLACAVLGVASITLLMDNFQLDKKPTPQQRQLSPRLMTSTFKHLITSPSQILLVPITLYRGLESAFMGGDFTKSFVSCSLGIWNIGYVMIVFGVANALFSVISSRVAKYTGQVTLFVFAFIVHGGLQAVLLYWEPSRDQVTYFYVAAAVWGLGNAIIQTQTNALYGCLFTDKLSLAFANHRLWEATGYAVAYAYSDYFCTDVKLFICVSVLSIGMAGYLAVEAIRRRDRTKTYTPTAKDDNCDC